MLWDTSSSISFSDTSIYGDNNYLDVVFKCVGNGVETIETDFRFNFPSYNTETDYSCQDTGIQFTATCPIGVFVGSQMGSDASVETNGVTEDCSETECSHSTSNVEWGSIIIPDTYSFNCDVPFRVGVAKIFSDFSARKASQPQYTNSLDYGSSTYTFEDCDNVEDELIVKRNGNVVLFTTENEILFPASKGKGVSFILEATCKSKTDSPTVCSSMTTIPVSMEVSQVPNIIISPIVSGINVEVVCTAESEKKQQTTAKIVEGSNVTNIINSITEPLSNTASFEILEPGSYKFVGYCEVEGNSESPDKLTDEISELVKADDPIVSCTMVLGGYDCVVTCEDNSDITPYWKHKDTMEWLLTDDEDGNVQIRNTTVGLMNDDPFIGFCQGFGIVNSENVQWDILKSIVETSPEIIVSDIEPFGKEILLECGDGEIPILEVTFPAGSVSVEGNPYTLNTIGAHKFKGTCTKAGRTTMYEVVTVELPSSVLAGISMDGIVDGFQVDILCAATNCQIKYNLSNDEGLDETIVVPSNDENLTIDVENFTTKYTFSMLSDKFDNDLNLKLSAFCMKAGEMESEKMMAVTLNDLMPIMEFENGEMSGKKVHMSCISLGAFPEISIYKRILIEGGVDSAEPNNFVNTGLSDYSEDFNSAGIWSYEMKCVALGHKTRSLNGQYDLLPIPYECKTNDVIGGVDIECKCTFDDDDKIEDSSKFINLSHDTPAADYLTLIEATADDILGFKRRAEARKAVTSTDQLLLECKQPDKADLEVLVPFEVKSFNIASNPTMASESLLPNELHLSINNCQSISRSHIIIKSVNESEIIDEALTSNFLGETISVDISTTQELSFLVFGFCELHGYETVETGSIPVSFEDANLPQLESTELLDNGKKFFFKCDGAIDCADCVIDGSNANLVVDYVRSEKLEVTCEENGKRSVKQELSVEVTQLADVDSLICDPIINGFDCEIKCDDISSTIQVHKSPFNNVTPSEYISQDEKGTSNLEIGPSDYTPESNQLYLYSRCQEDGFVPSEIAKIGVYLPELVKPQLDIENYFGGVKVTYKCPDTESKVIITDFENGDSTPDSHLLSIDYSSPIIDGSISALCQREGYETSQSTTRIITVHDLVEPTCESSPTIQGTDVTCTCSFSSDIDETLIYYRFNDESSDSVLTNETELTFSINDDDPIVLHMRCEQKGSASTLNKDINFDLEAAGLPSKFDCVEEYEEYNCNIECSEGETVSYRVLKKSDDVILVDWSNDDGFTLTHTDFWADVDSKTLIVEAMCSIEGKSPSVSEKQLSMTQLSSPTGNVEVGSQSGKFVSLYCPVSSELCYILDGNDTTSPTCLDSNNQDFNFPNSAKLETYCQEKGFKSSERRIEEVQVLQLSQPSILSTPHSPDTQTITVQCSDESYTSMTITSSQAENLYTSSRILPNETDSANIEFTWDLPASYEVIVVCERSGYEEQQTISNFSFLAVADPTFVESDVELGKQLKVSCESEVTVLCNEENYRKTLETSMILFEVLEFHTIIPECSCSKAGMITSVASQELKVTQVPSPNVSCSLGDDQINCISTCSSTLSSYDCETGKLESSFTYLSDDLKNNDYEAHPERYCCLNGSAKSSVGEDTLKLSTTPLPSLETVVESDGITLTVSCPYNDNNSDSDDGVNVGDVSVGDGSVSVPGGVNVGEGCVSVPGISVGDCESSSSSSSSNSNDNSASNGGTSTTPPTLTLLITSLNASGSNDSTLFEGVATTTPSWEHSLSIPNTYDGFKVEGTCSGIGLVKSSIVKVYDVSPPATIVTSLILGGKHSILECPKNIGDTSTDSTLHYEFNNSHDAPLSGDVLNIWEVDFLFSGSVEVTCDVGSINDWADELLKSEMVFTGNNNMFLHF
eukprot:TRINITY_DN3655_c0_g2_i1.p1 TRINITY_DN3655_c0_g2~~TRINITY_DN3655_c0_g2_i1.p1  ORF type:complete len:2107 (+),score=587.52 TRINITY_DN3655_c0_g2_i1:696-6323(+)